MAAQGAPSLTGLRAPPAAGFAAIAGAVDDSVRGGPLAGATVAILGTAIRAVTGADGLFRLDSIPPGEVQLMVRHPMLDTLLSTVTTAPFAVQAGRLDEVLLATPTLDRLRPRLCARGGVNIGRSILAGRVDDAETGAPVANALVSVVYKDASTPFGNQRVRSARSNADGLYVICGLPDMITGTVQAAVGANASSEISVETTATDALATASFLLGSATVSDSGRTGSAVLTGRIVDVAGRPVQDAQVAVEGGNGIALTDAEGSFTLRGLPSGTTNASIRKIGFAPALRTVHLRSREPYVLNVSMAAGARALAPVTVTAPAAEGLKAVGFEERLKMGNRTNFMFPEEIEKRQVARLTDLFRNLQGFIVQMAGNQQIVASSRAVSGGQEGCVAIFVDRIPFEQVSPGDLDSAFPVNTIGAIESYPSPASTPSEFRRAGRSCATLVIWTKYRLSKQ